MASGNHAVRRGFNTKYAAFTGAFPFIGDVSCGCCPEGTISAAVALVVDGFFVDFILGLLCVCAGEMPWECCLLAAVLELDVER